jgi:hypothetical protein
MSANLAVITLVFWRRVLTLGSRSVTPSLDVTPFKADCVRYFETKIRVRREEKKMSLTNRKERLTLIDTNSNNRVFGDSEQSTRPQTGSLKFQQGGFRLTP